MSLILYVIAIIICGWLITKMIPVIFRFSIYCFICIPVWILLSFIPGFYDESGFIILLFIIAFIRTFFKNSSKNNNQPNVTYPSYNYNFDSFKNYVLNKRTGIIHEKWSSTADTISEKHRKELSYSDAQELINKSRKYRFKE